MCKKIVALEYSLVTLFFAGVALFKLWEVLLLPNMAITNWGDGIGTIASLGQFESLLNQPLYNYLFDDFIANSEIGMGYMPSNPAVGTIWRVFLLPLLYLGVEPQNMYDILSLLTLILNALSGYLLARVLKAPIALSLLAGLLFMGLDNVDARLQSHLTLAATFGLLFQFSSAILAAQNSRPIYFVLLGITSWLSFQVVEYYGLYGGVGSVIIFVGYFAITPSHDCSFIARLKILSFNGLIAATTFFALMILSYPTMIAAKLGWGSENISILERVAYNYAELEAYSVRNVFQLFDSHFWSLGNYGNPGEFTFRIGAFIPIAIIGFTVLSIIFEKSQSIKFRISRYSQTFVFGFCAIVFVAIGLHPENPFSASRILFDFAPMFRVVARAYIVVDICVIAILMVVATRYLTLLDSMHLKLSSHVAFMMVAILLLVLAFLDAAGGGIKILAPKQLPITHSLFDELLNEKSGAVIELPFHNSRAAPHDSYEYLYNWSQHKHKLVNAPFSAVRKSDQGLANKIDSFSEDVNYLNENVIRKLGKHGVRYIVVNCPAIDDSYISKLAGVTLVNSIDCANLYEIEEVSFNYDLSQLIAEYSSRMPDPNVKITAADCKNIVLTATLADSVSKSALKPREVINLLLDVSNDGSKNWGADGADVKIGLVLFEPEKSGSSHSPNFGEVWHNMPRNLLAGENVGLQFEYTIPALPPGMYELWISVLQPGNLWCFHTEAKPVVVPITIEH